MKVRRFTISGITGKVRYYKRNRTPVQKKLEKKIATRKLRQESKKFN